MCASTHHSWLSSKQPCFFAYPANLQCNFAGMVMRGTMLSLSTQHTTIWSLTILNGWHFLHYHAPLGFWVGTTYVYRGELLKHTATIRGLVAMLTARHCKEQSCLPALPCWQPRPPCYSHTSWSTVQLPTPHRFMQRSMLHSIKRITFCHCTALFSQ